MRTFEIVEYEDKWLIIGRRIPSDPGCIVWATCTEIEAAKGIKALLALDAMKAEGNE